MLQTKKVQEPLESGDRVIWDSWACLDGVSERASDIWAGTWMKWSEQHGDLEEKHSRQRDQQEQSPWVGNELDMLQEQWKKKCAKIKLSDVEHRAR